MKSPIGNPDYMSGLQQTVLTNKVTTVIREFSNENKLSPRAVLYFLVSFTWGWARLLGVSSRELHQYSEKAYAVNDRLNAKAHG